MQPRPDGDYSPASALIAQGIRRHLGLDIPDGAHPFVLPGFAAGVRYTDSEARRIAAVRAAKGFSMFEDLRIREAAGDRLLFVADVPDVLWREPKSPAL